MKSDLNQTFGLRERGVSFRPNCNRLSDKSKSQKFSKFKKSFNVDPKLVTSYLLYEAEFEVNNLENNIHNSEENCCNSDVLKDSDATDLQDVSCMSVDFQDFSNKDSYYCDIYEHSTTKETTNPSFNILFDVELCLVSTNSELVVIEIKELILEETTGMVDSNICFTEMEKNFNHLEQLIYDVLKAELERLATKSGYLEVSTINRMTESLRRYLVQSIKFRKEDVLLLPNDFYGDMPMFLLAALVEETFAALGRRWARLENVNLPLSPKLSVKLKFISGAIHQDLMNAYRDLIEESNSFEKPMIDETNKHYKAIFAILYRQVYNLSVEDRTLDKIDNVAAALNDNLIDVLYMCINKSIEDGHIQKKFLLEKLQQNTASMLTRKMNKMGY